MIDKDMPFNAIIASLVAVIAWALFAILYVIYWSGNFNLFQNIVILLLSVVIVGCGLGIVWMYWVRRHV